jgi:hypothetical protein
VGAESGDMTGGSVLSEDEGCEQAAGKFQNRMHVWSQRFQVHSQIQLVIKLKIVKTLGPEIPPTLLVHADKVTKPNWRNVCSRHTAAPKGMLPA